MIDRERRIARAKMGEGGERHHCFLRGADRGAGRGGAAAGIGERIVRRVAGRVAGDLRGAVAAPVPLFVGGALGDHGARQRLVACVPLTAPPLVLT